ncbi:uncharacterized protein CTHT_0008280 [Thermochaetoides thermophila DSM 1495]|uniref:SPX domain-containing protein n=1 Tax=Chaetomium thermophilum (strain DSM 1495 / CBS 144.50 / IMI 039719) TaxID=759272 RepID=G0S006_CHATD|nr:hypothetical protein CTHT_0008280 [Thermochaetoides thermophila DSM 1495]EGS23167.1 hypothetical protein CTHT_0008280 [Thermochaetoides thermophila DSM 1495]
MRFGKTLKQSMYGPWKDQYIDYALLKSILREDRPDDEDEPWTEDDENRFCDEVFNIQLEKVAKFQADKVEDLRRRVDDAFARLKELPSSRGGGAETEKHHKEQRDREGEGEEEGGGRDKGKGRDEGEAEEEAPKPRKKSDAEIQRLRDLEAELDSITNEVKELKKYSSLNYTGFLKIVKKHDRKRGDRYKIRPLMQLSLAKRPFNSEQAYSPLLTKLSLMYFAIRQQLEDEPSAGPESFPPADPDSQSETHNGERYTAHKFWVHPDNLLELKTYILRQLPALVYSDKSVKDVEVQQEDPRITSLYFDNHKFDLYSRKVERETDVSSLRLRWYGQLRDRPEIVLEHKLLHANGTSEERRFAIKEKYVKPFLDGEYHMEKSIQKMERQGRSPEEIAAFRSTADAISEFVRENKLEPVVRANYVRTAFQKPGDDRVRILIDTDIVFIREDTLDRDRPCRNPREWHRLDIDNANMTYPFHNINQSEVSHFPYAVLEIKLREDAGRGNRRIAWVQDLMHSHLVHPCPRFSKFVHGTASLFEDYVNRLPFWLSDLDTDIRKDPQVAFEEEEERRARQAENEQAVGSLLGGKIAAATSASAAARRLSRSSPVAKSYLEGRLAAESTPKTPPSATFLSNSMTGAGPGRAEEQEEEEGEPTEDQPLTQTQSKRQRRQGNTLLNYGTLFPSFTSLTKYSRFRRISQSAGGPPQSQAESRRRASLASLPLPPGVTEPEEWLKNSGPLQIEPKVWLANERTFLKWAHISVLLGGLAVSLYSAGGAQHGGKGDLLTQAMGVAFLGVAAFAAGWSYWVLEKRREMIIMRSGRDFDFVVGPLVVSGALMVALVVNLVIAWKRVFAGGEEGVVGGIRGLGNVSSEVVDLKV